jgi:antibiotic biosynthesis monooxygenase (ABM) superfamily enzyme
MADTTLTTQATTGAEIEYTALREELVKRMEARTQFISITLTLGGAFLGIGWGQGAVALLVFPPLAALLASGWAQNETRLQQIQVYIREQLSEKIPGLGWEKFAQQMDQQTRSTGWLMDLFSVGGIFILTQILAIFLGSFRLDTTQLVQVLLMVVALASVVIVALLINHVRRQIR